MKFKAIALATLSVCIAAAFCDLTGSTPIERLLERPKSGSFPANSIGGVHPVALRSARLPELLQRGRTNVFVFYADNCPGSNKLLGYVSGMTRMRPDVAFQLVNLGPQWRGRDVAVDYGIQLASVPHVMIYTPEGTLLAADTQDAKTGLELLCDWVRSEIEARSGTPTGST